MLLIPAIDLRCGRCVRLLQGDFSAETRYEIEAHELMMRYRALGAAWVHVVDLDGARDGTQANRAIIVALASQRAVRLQVGGGLRDAAAIDSMMRSGVARSVIGSSAVSAPADVRAWLERWGPEQVTLAFDVTLDEQGMPRCRIEGWRKASSVTLWDAVDEYTSTGLRHVLCTDIGRDGAMAGPNLALYSQAVERYPQIAWQASGGVRDAADLRALASTGVAAAISGRALLEERIPTQELQPFLRGA